MMLTVFISSWHTVNAALLFCFWPHRGQCNKLTILAYYHQVFLFYFVFSNVQFSVSLTTTVKFPINYLCWQQKCQTWVNKNSLREQKFINAIMNSWVKYSNSEKVFWLDWCLDSIHLEQEVNRSKAYFLTTRLTETDHESDIAADFCLTPLTHSCTYTHSHLPVSQLWTQLSLTFMCSVGWTDCIYILI